MKLQRLLILFVLVSIALSACSQGTSPDIPVLQTAQVPTPFIDSGKPPQAVTEAQIELAKKLNIAPGLITVRAVEQVEWPNTCLGMQKPDEACGEMIVSGFRAVFVVNGVSYEAHTDADGAQIRFVEDGGKGEPVSSPNVSPAAVAARSALADALGVSTATVRIIRAEAITWPDSCLGVHKPEETCLAALTPGFIVMLEVDGKTYQVNTNADGSATRVIEPKGQMPPALEEEKNKVVESVRQLLAQQSGVKAAAINLVEVEAVDWPNGCLGIEMPGRMCTQVITPGFKVVLESAGKTYAFHTDQAGGVILPAIAPLPQTADKVIVWEQSEGASCNRVEIGVKGAAYGECTGTLQNVVLKTQRVSELTYLFAVYSGFTSATRSGTIVFQGQGQQEPVDAEMRSIAEWAMQVFAESQGSGQELIPTITWHREGGIAGFCNELVIYPAGWAHPSSCKVGQSRDFNNFRLSADDLSKIYGWVDEFESFEYEQKDNAVADGMTVRLSFVGTGTKKAPLDLQSEIIIFAQQIYSSAVE